MSGVQGMTSLRCPHFRGWYVQASMELGPEDVSLLERCPHVIQMVRNSILLTKVCVHNKISRYVVYVLYN